MGAPDVDTPEPTKEEKELLEAQTETLKLIREVGKENVQINRMLFPFAAQAIGLEPVYSQDQANEVFDPPEDKKEKEKQKAQGGGTDVFGSIFSAAITGTNTTAFDSTDNSSQVGGGATEGGGQNKEIENSGTSFGDIIGFKPVETRGFPGTPEPGELGSISDIIPEFAGERFKILNPEQEERANRRAIGGRSEAAFERNRKRIADSLRSNLTPEEARALLGL